MGARLEKLRDGPLALAALALLFVAAIAALAGLFPASANADGTAYLNLAQHYLDGELHEAVVSHWAPLYSWLVAPLLGLGILPVTAGVVVQGASGLLVLAACWLLLGRLSVEGWLRFLTCLALIPLLVRYAHSILGPDLLTAGIFLWFLVVLTDPRRQPDSLRFQLVVGLLVGLAYLAKGTPGLGLTLIALLVASFIRWRGEVSATGAQLRSLALMLLTAGALVIPWAVAISVDEESPTLGTSSAYTWAVVGPEREDEHPTTSDGFLEPPHQRAVSAWEDPARLDVEPWSPVDDPGYAIKRFAKNLARYVKVGLESVPIAGLLALIGLFAVARSRRHLPWVLAGFALLIPIAYSPIVTQERYAWASYLLVVVLAGAAVARLVERRSLGSRAAVLLLGLVVLSNAALAARELDIDGLGTGEEERRVADVLDDLGVTNVAASTEWHESLAAAFHADERFFGVPRRGEDPASIRAGLDRLRIDGFLLWERRDRPRYLEGFSRGPTKRLNQRRVTIFHRRQ